MKEFIYEKSNSISDIICDQLISHFENHKMKHCKTTNLEYTITDVYEYIIEDNSKLNLEKEIYTLLLSEINTNIKNYYENIPFYQNPHICTNHMVIQKYIKNSGKDDCHHDFVTIKQKIRIFTYMWFLNDVSSGGEICFFNNYNIVPEKGKLIIFPAEWFFSYTNKIPISDNKYIITGHLYYDV